MKTKQKIIEFHFEIEVAGHCFTLILHLNYFVPYLSYLEERIANANAPDEFSAAPS